MAKKRQSEIDKWLNSLPKSKQKTIAKESWDANTRANPQKKGKK